MHEPINLLNYCKHGRDNKITRGKSQPKNKNSKKQKRWVVDKDILKLEEFVGWILLKCKIINHFHLATYI